MCIIYNNKNNNIYIQVKKIFKKEINYTKILFNFKQKFLYKMKKISNQ